MNAAPRPTVEASNSASAPIRVLMLEDDVLDAELVIRTLDAAGIRCEARRVETRAAFAEALASGGFELILADYTLPAFDGISALAMARQTAPDVPFVIVSGTLGEEPAIQALTGGAVDYVVKGRLGRLGHSVRRALAEARDRAERERAERALQASERRYRALYHENPSMYFTLAADGTLLSVNRFGAAQLGYTPGELGGCRLEQLHALVDVAAMHSNLAQCLEEPGSTHRWEIRKVRRDGRPIWVRETARVIFEESGTPNILTVCEDTSEARQLSQELTYQASHDSLTGLVNRREFERRLRRVIETVRDDGGESALCYLDLDQFKVINDTCGHAAGDELLRQLAGLMIQRVRKRDTLARLGGDEFGVLIEHCTQSDAQRVAHDLSEAIEQFRFLWEDKVFSVGVSIGLVAIDSSSRGVSDVLAAADSACYAAKEQGRSRIHLYRPDDVELARRRGEMQWVARLNATLEEQRFRLWYQPIVAVGGAGAESGHHLELLVRLIDEHGRLVEPAAFLPAAERYNLSSRIDRWVVENALDWLASEPDRLQSLALCSINLSGQSLGDEAFFEFLCARTAEHPAVRQGKVCLEVTETAAVANLAAAIRFMSVLRGIGIRFALDDFGSGLSSFAYLKNLPVDFLKIDGMFVKDIVDDPIDRAMVKSIDEIGKVMGKRTIAEFVESQRIFDCLAEIGVDFAQGFAVGRPAPIDSFDPTR